MKVKKPNDWYKPNIKGIRQQPRHKIRQLLRSFIPINSTKRLAESGQQSGQD